MLRERHPSAQWTSGAATQPLFMRTRATQIEPESAGLHANLALACVLAGRIDEAQRSIEHALAAASDTISQTIRAIIQHFATNGRTPPKTTAELQSYWGKNRAA
jgi:hypothetical protein